MGNEESELLAASAVQSKKSTFKLRNYLLIGSFNSHLNS